MSIETNSPNDDERSEADDPKPDLDHQSLFQSLDIPRIRTFATYCPLIAAIIAPVATLLDIPALTVSTICDLYAVMAEVRTA